MYAYTTSGGYRPFGAQVLVAGFDADKAAKAAGGDDGASSSGWELYMVEVDGTYHRYFGMAIGKGARTCKTEIEKAKLWTRTAKEALVDVSRMLHTVHDDSKEKPMEMEMSWIKLDAPGGEAGEFGMVPRDVLAGAVAEGKRQAEAAGGEGEGDAAMEGDEEEDIDG